MSATSDLMSQAPLQFEPNRGQTDAQARYLSRGPGYSLFLTESEAVLSLASPGAEPVALRMSLVGANPHPEIVGLDPEAGSSNYFKGHGPSVTGVEHFARVEYKQVYPGVDLVYYGTNQRQLEYDFVLSPGADPNAIRIQFQGMTGLELDASGQLVLHTVGGDVVEHAPITYQRQGGQRQNVASHYAIHEGQVEIQVGDYDHSRELVIDPVLGYSSYLGGSGVDKAMSVAAGSNGIVFVTGVTASVDFPIAGKPFKGSKPAKDTGDVFVTKFDTMQSGKQSLVYSTFLGGSSGEEGKGIVVDDLGHAFVVGWTDSHNDFPTGGGVPGFQKVGNAARSGFLVELSKDGSSLLYSSFIHSKDNSSAASTEAWGVARLGDIITVVGLTAEDNFPTDNGFQFKRAGGTDAFLMDLDQNKDGSASLKLSTYFGGGGDDGATSVATGFLGSSWVTGYTQSHDGKNSIGFPVTADALQTSLTGTQHAFVARIDGPSTDFVPLSLGFSSYLGGTGGLDIGYSITTDGISGRATVGGTTNSMDFPTTANPGFKFDFPSYHDTLVGSSDGFVVQVESSNLVDAKFVYSSFLGGQSPSSAVYGVAIDQAGAVYAVGEAGHNLQAIGPQLPGGNSGNDAFLVRFDPTGQMNYSSRLGGGGADRAYGVAISKDGFIFLAGQTDSTGVFSFPTTPTAAQLSLGGAPEASSPDGFLTRIELEMPAGDGKDPSNVGSARLSAGSPSAQRNDFDLQGNRGPDYLGQVTQDVKIGLDDVTPRAEMDRGGLPMAPKGKHGTAPVSRSAIDVLDALFSDLR